MVDFYPHHIRFQIPGETQYVDNRPVFTDPVETATKCNIQPISASVAVQVDGMQQVKKYIVFVPNTTDIRQILKSNIAVMAKTSFENLPTDTDKIEWDVLDVYEKSFQPHEIILGKNG